MTTGKPVERDEKIVERERIDQLRALREWLDVEDLRQENIGYGCRRTKVPNNQD